MAMEGNVLQAFKAAINVVPKFDGNVNHLYRFLTTCETILGRFYDENNPGSFDNQIVLHSIISKLEGKADEAVNINGSTTWQQIKDVLLQHFSDQRDENSLNRDLVNLKQENESPHQFYNRCLHLLNTIVNYVNLHEQLPNVRDCKRDFFTAQALKTFLAGLKEPLGSTIRAMRPDNLPIALQYIKEEENIQYIRNKNNYWRQSDNKPIGQPKPFINSNKSFPSQMNNKSNNYPNNNKGFTPRPNNNNINQTLFNKPSFPFKSQPFKQQFQQQSSNQPKPEPMSGISYQSAQRKPNIPYQQPRNMFQPITQSKDFIFEELNAQQTFSDDVEQYEQNIDSSTELMQDCSNYESEEMVDNDTDFREDTDNEILT